MEQEHNTKKRCTAIVLAAGQGSRMGTKVQKQYLEIAGKPVLYYSLAAFEESEIIDDVIVVVGEGQTEYCRKEIVEKYRRNCWKICFRRQNTAYIRHKRTSCRNYFNC